MSADNLKLSELLNSHWLSKLADTIKSQPDAEKFLGVSREKTFPKRELTFAALNHVESPEHVKVVIFGQDPYPREASAVGVAFNDGEIKKWTDKFSPSFRNIIKNALIGQGLAKADTDVATLRTTLTKNNILDPPDWFDNLLEQGVCWLNTSLTFTSTDQADLKRHLTFWKPIVEKIIEIIIDAKRGLADKEKSALVFVFWGGHAQKLAKSIEKINKASKPELDIRFIEANHPAANGDAFHAVLSFESVNKHLSELGAKPISWLPNRAGSQAAATGKRSLDAEAPKAVTKAAPKPEASDEAPKSKAKQPKKAAATNATAAAPAAVEPAASSSSGRPRRAATKVSYVEANGGDSDEESDDEGASSNRSSRKPPAKRAKRE